MKWLKFWGALAVFWSTTWAIGAESEAPPPELSALEWVRLFPEGSLQADHEEGGGEEFWVNARLRNVREPSLGGMRSTIGEGPHPAVVICAGGGYHHLAILQEAYPLALWLNARGIDAYLLKYRLMEWGYPAPLQDVTRAVRLLRSKAGEWEIDPARIGVVGFSAGGHLAGMSATLWDAPEAQTGDTLDAISARPDWVAMIYPVVTMLEPHVNRGSRDNLLGAESDQSVWEALSLERRVRPDSPPVFLVHTNSDTAVPAENSLQFATALRANGVPVELHLYAEGPHGFGLRPGYGAASEWPTQFGQWLETMGLIPEPK